MSFVQRLKDNKRAFERLQKKGLLSSEEKELLAELGVLEEVD